jgi:SAM-dependent methyltransferase
VRPSSLTTPLSSEAFAITDANYGVTAAVFRCQACGFLECPQLDDVVRYYEDLEDESYEAGRAQRCLQFRKILARLKRVRPAGRLLDVGAGTGMLVEEAGRMGYRAEGVEPSRWLQAQAAAHGLPVRLGTFPHPECPGPYDVITLIDVIEHVSQPLQLLRAVRTALAPGGVVALVTPDVRSVMARLLGWKWWHFRVAHVGYFDRKTLELAMEKTGFRPLSMHRPSWYFPADYLFERVRRFLPLGRLTTPAFLARITIPVNLRDSILGIYE